MDTILDWFATASIAIVVSILVPLTIGVSIHDFGLTQTVINVGLFIVFLVVLYHLVKE